MEEREWQGWIGSEEEAEDVIVPRLSAGLAALLDIDIEAEAGIEAPLGIHWCLAPPIAPQSSLGRDGHPARGGFLPPIPLERRMWAGSAMTFHDTLRTGDRVRRRSTVADVALKQGRSGRLCFVGVTHRYETERGLAIAEKQDIVYRDGSGLQAAPSGRPKPFEADSDVIEAGPALLFRYSALTFNGHRIHYDLPYARDVEGYAGLVVHGPLQATLLLHLAARLRGRRPAHFSFRGVAPLIGGQKFALGSVPTAEGLDLHVVNEIGVRTMAAAARWQ